MYQWWIPEYEYEHRSSKNCRTMHTNNNTYQTVTNIPYDHTGHINILMKLVGNTITRKLINEKISI
jgi:hypothetical protein